MKAVIRDSYGPPDVLELQETKKPIPKDDEILMKVHTASVNHADSHGLRGTPFMARIILGGLIKPKVKILGYDFAGQVELVGKDVSEFQPDDEVFGTSKGAGGFAEYLCTTEDLMLIKPPNDRSAFGVVFNVDLLSTFVAVALGVAVMWGLGMIGAGVQIITKRWDPVTWFFTMLSSLLSGVWFPYELLPASLQTVSKIIPQRYILEMLRSAMLRAEPITALWDSLIPLLISALASFSLALLSIRNQLNMPRNMVL
jgi:hypothetical protein